jgi:hypothetical protein
MPPYKNNYCNCKIFRDFDRFRGAYQGKLNCRRNGGSRCVSKEKAIPIFRDVARDYPFSHNDVCPISAFAEAGRKSTPRKRCRHLPRNGLRMVEPVQSGVCNGDQKTSGSRPVIFTLEVAFELGFRSDQRRTVLSVAGS